jgi:hypothetical protein
VYTPFIDDLEVVYIFPDQGRVRTLYQLGFHIGVEPPLDLLIVKLKRFGINFLAGDSTGAIKLNSGFPF